MLGAGWPQLAGRASGTGVQSAQCQPCPVTLALLPQKGVFRLSNEDYFIEPLEGVQARPGHAQPHVVYKRQAPERERTPGDPVAAGTCGVQGMRRRCRLWGRPRAWRRGALFWKPPLSTRPCSAPLKQKDADRPADITVASTFRKGHGPGASAARPAPALGSSLSGASPPRALRLCLLLPSSQPGSATGHQPPSRPHSAQPTTANLGSWAAPPLPAATSLASPGTELPSKRSGLWGPLGRPAGPGGCLGSGPPLSGTGTQTHSLPGFTDVRPPLGAAWDRRAGL